jgi:Domain of unknown function (DUF6894)
VPRYFFHFSDGKRQFTDAAGVECHGVATARAHAIRHARELKVAICYPHIQDLSGWTMVVADAAGRTVFEIDFNLNPVFASLHS